jgi:hypothetical protein
MSRGLTEEPEEPENPEPTIQDLISLMYALGMYLEDIEKKVDLLTQLLTPRTLNDPPKDKL